jgi:hypothetical protein
MAGEKAFDFGAMMSKFNTPENKYSMEAFKKYESGEMTDAEFEEWKIKLTDKCPWFKRMEAKHVAGDLEEAFPFTKTMEEMKKNKMGNWGGMMGGMMGKQFGHQVTLNFVVLFCISFILLFSPCSSFLLGFCLMPIFLIDCLLFFVPVAVVAVVVSVIVHVS